MYAVLISVGNRQSRDILFVENKIFIKQYDLEKKWILRVWILNTAWYW
jgi:hypothetical protein